jgi:hypothetical protein
MRCAKMQLICEKTVTSKARSEVSQRPWGSVGSRTGNFCRNNNIFNVLRHRRDRYRVREALAKCRFVCHDVPLCANSGLACWCATVTRRLAAGDLGSESFGRNLGKPLGKMADRERCVGLLVRAGERQREARESLEMSGKVRRNGRRREFWLSALRVNWRCGSLAAAVVARPNGVRLCLSKEPASVQVFVSDELQKQGLSATALQRELEPPLRARDFDGVLQTALRFLDDYPNRIRPGVRDNTAP